MNAQWPVRVAGGSGFLVDGERVLTAAHVVDGTGPVTVRFPARPDLGDVPATVEFTGAWRRGGHPHGDVAVLRLDRPVDVVPARFAAEGALDLPHGLVVIGFPASADGYERIAAVHALAPWYLVDGEWTQLRSDEAFGPVVGRGYSGAAVTLRATGEVIGMVTAADRQDRIGHMLSTARLRAHWGPIADLLPLGPVPPGEHRALRTVLRDVPVADARDAARRATGADDPEPDGALLAAARSAYDVAAYLAQGLVADPRRARDLVARFTAALTAPPRPPADVTVCVQVSRSGAGPRKVLLGVRLFAGGEPLAEICHEVVTVTRLRARVEELLPRAIDERVPPQCRVAVEFVLPRAWLSLPVDTWAAEPGGSVQLGWRHPVTVRDLARYQRTAPDREHDRRWAHLRAGGDDVVHWVDCRDAVEAARLAAALAVCGERAVLALAARPDPVERHPALRAGFDSGMPVMLWRRAACPQHGGDGECPGQHFRSRLSDRIAALPRLTELPELTRLFRAQAGPDGDQLTLLWEPPVPRDRAPALGLASGGGS